MVSYNEFDTVWVPPGRVVDVNGTVHDTIQSAHDVPGNTLAIVGTGTFEENVEITTDGFTLEGTNRDTLIDGTDGDAVTVDAEDVTITSLDVRTDGTDLSRRGIFGGSNCDTARVENVRVRRAAGTGIHLTAGGDHTVRDCLLQACQWGVSLEQTGGGENSRAVGNRFDPTIRSGGLVIGDEGAHATANLFTGVPSSSIEVHGTATAATVSSNVIRNNGDGGAAIDVAADNASITSNTITDSGLSAIYVDENSFDTKLDSNYVHTSPTGFDLGGTGTRVINNTLIGITDEAYVEQDTATAVRYRNNEPSTNDTLVAGGTTAISDVAASGSVTLSSGLATIDTGVPSDELATFMVALGPATDDADVAADVRASSAGNYEVDIQETDTNVGDPSVEYDILRVR